MYITFGPKRVQDNRPNMNVDNVSDNTVINTSISNRDQFGNKQTTGTIYIIRLKFKNLQLPQYRLNRKAVPRHPELFSLLSLIQ